MWLATLNSLRGLKHCYHSEAAFRQEVRAALLLVPLAIWLGQTAATRWHGERMDYVIAIDSLLYRTRRSALVAPPPPQP